MDQVKFRAMKDGDAADYAFLTKHEIEHTKGTASRLLNGADIDWVVSTLLHDIGDIFAPYNHDEYAASILRPFVREQCSWVVEKHGDFQMLYYGQHVGANPDKRETYRGHIYFDDCAIFCERWDQNSFDPDYDTLPVSHFEERVQEVFARQAYDPSVIRPGVRDPLTR